MKGDTTNATVSGTYRYMAPEVYMKKPYDNTVDIYSLGLVLYWLLNNRRMPYLPTDRVPKASENEAALEKRMSGQRMERPLNGSDALKDVVMKACAYNRKDRYQRGDGNHGMSRHSGFHTGFRRDQENTCLCAGGGLQFCEGLHYEPVDGRV